MCRDSWHKRSMGRGHDLRQVTSRMPGLNAWQGRKEHQDPALASEGSTAQQAGGAATDTEEEKLLLLLLLLPNRLSSFSCPTLPCSGVGLCRNAPGALWGRALLTPAWAQLPFPGLLLAEGEHNHVTAAAPDTQPTQAPLPEGCTTLGHTQPWWHRGKGLELHPTAHWNSWLQDDRLN